MTEYHKNGKYDSEGIEAKIGADLKKTKTPVHDGNLHTI